MTEVQKSVTAEHELPRRVLNWVMAAVTMAILPHLEHLPWWLGGFYAVLATWRWRLTSLRALPRRGLLLLMTLGTVGIIGYSYRAMFARDAGVVLLAAMAALKCLELRGLRDGMVLIFLGYFLAAANLLYTQSPAMVAYLLTVLLILLVTQVIIQHQHAGLPVRVVVWLCARMLIQSVPLMLVLFILFPRVHGPLWSLPKDPQRRLTGLSDTMAPGSISQLSSVDTVALRVWFFGPVPPLNQLYWRGPVLWRFDGESWTGGEKTSTAAFSYTALGAGVDYAVTLEPHGQRWLFALDLPARLPTQARMTASWELLNDKAVHEVLHYEMRSYLSYRSGALEPEQRIHALQLPATANPRARALAAAWRAQDPHPEAIIRAALTLFREQAFGYTLRPPLLTADDKVDEFLFDTRLGFCEHYTGSFVFLMRAAGIPARVVTGYQGGELNGLGDYLMVRQSDAHAWAEVWLQAKGWVRVDPTAAVAPERVEQGLYAAVADPNALPFLTRRDNAWWRQIILVWDVLNNAWNESVLAYGPERQRELLSNIGFWSMDWPGMTVALVLSLIGAGLVMVGLQAWYRRAAVDPVAGAYQRFCAKLARRGLAREAHEGPLDFAERLTRRRPDLAAQVRLIGRLYARLRYGRPTSEDLVRRLRRLVRLFRP